MSGETGLKRTVRCLLFWINTHLTGNLMDSSSILSSKKSESLMKCEKNIYFFFLISLFNALKMLIEAWLKVSSVCVKVVQRLDLWNTKEILCMCFYWRRETCALGRLLEFWIHFCSDNIFICSSLTGFGKDLPQNGPVQFNFQKLLHWEKQSFSRANT